MEIMEISFQFNCGFARVGIKEIINIIPGKKRSELDFNQIQRKFREEFDITSFQIPAELFVLNSRKQTPFQVKCMKILDAFSRSWNKATDKHLYMQAFKLSNWQLLSPKQKSTHTLSKCIGCYTESETLQKSFPIKPPYIPECSIKLTPGPEKLTARKVLKDVNREWEREFGHTLTEHLPRLCPEANLTHKKSKHEQRRQSRKRKRDFSEHVSQQMAKNATLTMLANGKSFSKYHKERITMSFETPGDIGPSKQKKEKSHSPSEENITWDTQSVLTDLASFPVGIPINWSKFAREHDVPGRNAGQVVKAFAKKDGIDTFELDNRSNSTPRKRPSKNKLPGNEISSPCMPSLAKVKQEMHEMIMKGIIWLGEPVAPHTIQRFKVTNNGEVITCDVVVNGRKTSLLNIRKHMLQQQEQYMHLMTDEDIQSMTEGEKQATLKKNHITAELYNKADMQQRMAKIQHNRMLA